MPTASDEQRNTMNEWFGDPISEEGPIKFLESHGYVLQRDWQWDPPTRHHTMSCYENECLLFLIHEWDFGDVVNWRGKMACLCGRGKDFCA